MDDIRTSPDPVDESPSRIINVDGRRRRPWALGSRDKLLSAAVAEITAVGFERARLTEIARRAGMTAGSVYTWFENKEDLFQAALEDALTSQISGNAAALEGTDLDGDWPLAIAMLVPRNHVDSDTTDAQRLLIESYYAAWRDPKAREKLLGSIESHLAMYRAVLDSAARQGRIASDIDLDALAMVLLAIPTGLSMLNLAGLPRVPDRHWAPLYSRFFSALGR